MRFLVSAIGVMVALSGCASELGDGTSISYGQPAAGALRNGVKLPLDGDGYLVPKQWRERGNNWGTDELVDLIVRASRRVAREIPGSQLSVADLSPPGGGKSQWHRSHESGLDADLIFFTTVDGRPAPPQNDMFRYGADGRIADKDRANPEAMRVPTRRIDFKRQWALVRALLTDPYVEVQWLFIYEPLRERLLAHALEIGEDPALIARASVILHQPAGALPHDDHMHLRIYCPPGDHAYGCIDHEPMRWEKDSYKYVSYLARALEVAQRLPAPLAVFGSRVICTIGPVLL